MSVPYRNALDLTATLLLVGLAGIALWSQAHRQDAVTDKRPQPVQLPLTSVGLGEAVKGSQDAPVGLIVFSDFECPYCARLARTTLQAVDTKYVRTGKVLLSFRHFPIEAIHRSARYAAEATACARRQGRFWELHDVLFAPGASLEPSYVSSAVQHLGLDMGTWGDCVRTSDARDVDRDLADAIELGLRSTPTALVGRRDAPGTVLVSAVLVGDRPEQDFVKAIDLALKTATEHRR